MALHSRSAIAAACTLASSLVGFPANGDAGNLIEQMGTGLSFHTATGQAAQNGVTMRGLNKAVRKGDFVLRSYWEKGAFRPTITFDGKIVVDGKDIDDVSRISTFRFDRDGSHAYIRTTKGPAARVELVYNGDVSLQWPRQTAVSILALRRDGVLLSVFDTSDQRTTFYRHARIRETIEAKGTALGSFVGCALLGSRPRRRAILLRVYCDPEKGSDLLRLDLDTGETRTLRATVADEFIAPRHLSGKSGESIIAVSGSPSATTAFHAISGVLLRGLGEPVSLASDAAGMQSWTQSYRTLALATLFRKSGHAVFADLARIAMRNTLSVRNADLGIGGAFNPGAGWASRIYSTDRRSPVSLLVNQAMISGALLRACEVLDEQCPADLRSRIMKNASRLVDAYERDFNKAAGLYRIQYGAPFRFDGIWAPWNWHLTWSVVLDRVGAAHDRPALSARAAAIANAFVQSWTLTAGGALWRYWAPVYYSGWQSADRVSTQRPAKGAEPTPKRYEDVHHAGLSLMGLGAIRHGLPSDAFRSVQTTLDRLLDNGAILPRDLDGKGPQTPRWLPGAGWDTFQSDKIRARYAKHVPGAAAGHRLLAYASLFDPAASFELTLTVLDCTDIDCTPTRIWSFDTLDAFLESNPLFRISRVGAN